MPDNDDFESISNAIASGGEPNDVLQLIVRRTCELLEVDRAYIFLKEGDTVQTLQLIAASDENARVPPLTVLPDSLESWVVGRGRALALPATPSPGVNARVIRSTLLALSEDASRVTQIGVPILSRSSVIGVLVVLDNLENAVGPAAVKTSINQATATGINFQLNQILSFLSVLSDLVSLALENRQIMRRQNRRNQLIALLRFISHTSLNQTTGLEEMSSSIADQIGLACRAEKVDIMLYSQETDELVTLGTTNTSLSQLQVQLGLDHLPLATAGRLSEVFLTGQPFLSGQIVAADLAEQAEKLGINSLLIVPLQVEQQRQGVISLASPRPMAFSEDDLSFINFVSLRLGYTLRHEELTHELAQAEAARIEADQRENFIATVAHDLKNVLAVIRGNNQLSLKRMAGGNTGLSQRTHQLTLTKASQALTLIEDMVEVNQMDRGSFRLFRSEIELVSLMLEEIEAIQTLYSDANITFHSDYNEVELSADPNRLRQVVSNLLVNALHYSPTGSPIELKIVLAPALSEIESKIELEMAGTAPGQLSKLAEGLLVLVTLTDQGIGISRADQARIFERFYRGNGAQMVSGSGLGLYISRQIVLQHGGQLWVESEESRGSTFHLLLPVNRLL